jgi:hypothetical protein
MLKNQVKRAERHAERTEYAWDKNWCGSRVVDPLSFEELQGLGVFRIKKTPPDSLPGRGRRFIMPPMGGARDFSLKTSR